MSLTRKIKKATIPYMVGKLWQYSAGRRKKVILYLGLFVVSNLFDLLTPLVIVCVANEYQHHGGIDHGNFLKILILFTIYPVLKCIFWAFHGPARVIETINAFIVKADFKRYMVEGVMSWSYQKHSEHKAGDTITRIAKAGSSLEKFCEGSFNLVTLFMRMISVFIILSYLEKTSVVVVAVMLSLTFMIIMKFDRKLIKQNRELHEEDNAVSERISDNITNIRSVIIHRVEKAISQSIGGQLISPLQLKRQYMIGNESKWFSATMGAAIMASLTMILHVYLKVRANTALEIGMIMALWSYLMRIGETIFTFAEQYASIVKYKIEVESCERLEEHFQNQRDKAWFVETKLPELWHEIEIKALNLTHEVNGVGKFKLRSSGIVIDRSQKIALIGESGSGKSTFLTTIRDLYKPDKAEIYLDGRRLEGGFASISSNIALINQEVEMFSTTILNNITFGIEELDDLAKHFTDMACLTSVVEQLPDGFNSSLSDKGVNLSGGQRQRLALARAFLHARDKQIILVDEPTSNVDMLVNEQQIFKNLFAEFGDKAIVCALHGLHLLDLFDTVSSSQNPIFEPSLGD